MSKLSDLLKRHDILTSQERELAQIEREISDLKAEQATAEAAKANAAKAAALAKAQAGQDAAEQAVAKAVQVLAAAIADLDVAEAELRTMRRIVPHRVPVGFRREVRGQLERWRQRTPAILGLPVPSRADPREAALQQARESVRDAEAMIRTAKANGHTNLYDHWREALRGRKVHLALLEGRPPEPELRPEDAAMLEALHERATFPGQVAIEGRLIAGIVQRRAEKAQGAKGA